MSLNLKERTIYCTLTWDEEVKKKKTYFAGGWGKMSEAESNATALRTGNKLIVVDVDTKDFSLLTKPMRKLLKALTPTIETARGFHYYFRYENSKAFTNKANYSDFVDVRSDGGIIFNEYNGDSPHISYTKRGKIMDSIPKKLEAQLFADMKKSKKVSAKRVPWSEIEKGAIHNGVLRYMNNDVRNGRGYEDILKSANQYVKDYLGGTTREFNLMVDRLEWAMDNIEPNGGGLGEELNDAVNHQDIVEIKDIFKTIPDIEKEFNDLVSKGANKDEVYELIALLDDISEQRILAKRMIKMNRSAYDGLLMVDMMTSIHLKYEERPDIKVKREQERIQLNEDNETKTKNYPYPDVILSESKEGVIEFEVKSTRKNMKTLLKINSIKSNYDVITRSIHAQYNGKDYDFSKEADIVRSDIVSLGQMDEYLHHSKKVDIDRRLIADHYDLAIQGKHINPLIDFIKKQHKKSKHKGTDAIKAMVKALNSDTGTKKYQNTILKKWLVQCVAAWDGCENKGSHKYGVPKYESVFVLSGNQGRGKTKFFNRLMSPFSHVGNYFMDGATFQKGDKDNLMQITSYALVELGELDRLKTTGASDFKAFTSKQVDEFRMPYAKVALTYTRHTSFCGSVNHAEFLNDITGARRFLIMEVGEIKLNDFVPLDVWIEAWDLYINGESWWLDDDFDIEVIQERDKINDSATDNGVAQDLYLELTELIPKVKGNVAKGRISPSKIIGYLTGNSSINGFTRAQLISLIRKGAKYKIANNGSIELGEDGVKCLERYTAYGHSNIL